MTVTLPGPSSHDDITVGNVRFRFAAVTVVVPGIVIVPAPANVVPSANVIRFAFNVAPAATSIVPLFVSPPEAISSSPASMAMVPVFVTVAPSASCPGPVLRSSPA
jgi:hypothetical protein